MPSKKGKNPDDAIIDQKHHRKQQLFTPDKKNVHNYKGKSEKKPLNSRQKRRKMLRK